MTITFPVGVRQLWREHILGRYLRREISREEAIQAAASSDVGGFGMGDEGLSAIADEATSRQ